jgi:integrase
MTGKRRRSPGEGSIYQRKSDGQWVGTIPLGFNEHGKRLRKTIYGSTQRDVRVKLEQIKVDLEGGIEPVASRAPTVAELLHRYLEHRRPDWSPTTYRRHAGVVQKHLIPTIGRLQVNKLTVTHVQRVLDAQRDSGAAPRSVQYTRAVLRAALNLGIKWDLVRRNVAAQADAPRLIYTEVEPLTRGEALTLLKALTGDRLEHIYAVAMTLGLRQAELIGLRWEDIDLDQRALHVRQTIQRIDGEYLVSSPKTEHSRRTVVFPSEIAERLRAQRVAQLEERLAARRDWEDSGLVFTNKRGGPLYGPFVTRHLQKELEAAGLRRIRFHDLRHTSASMLLMMGVELAVIQRTLGHTSITTTANIYAHILPELQEHAAARMGAFLRGEA